MKKVIIYDSYEDYKQFSKSKTTVKMKFFSETQLRFAAIKFFYHWVNASGTNTEQGFDEFWHTFRDKLEAEYAEAGAVSGAVYRHFRTKRTYEVLYTEARVEAAPNEAQVVYRCTETGRVWIRPYSNFSEEVVPGIRRFALVSTGKEVAV